MNNSLVTEGARCVVPRDALLRAVRTAARAAARGKKEPDVLKTVLLSSAPDGLRLDATDLTHWLTLRLPAAGSIQQPCLINARESVAALAAAPKGTLSLTCADDSLTVAAGDGYAVGLPTVDTARYPTLPPPPARGTPCVRFDTRALLAALAYVVPLADTDAARPEFTGVHVHVTRQQVRFVAVDGYRMALLDMPAARSRYVDDLSVTLPAASLDLVRALSKTAPHVTLFLGQYPVFAAPAWRCTIAPVGPRFINYHTLLAKEFTARVTAETAALADAFTLLRPACSQRDVPIVTLEPVDQGIRLSTPRSATPLEMVVPARVDGTLTPIHVNAAFMLDSLAVQGPRTVMEFQKTPFRPFTVRPADRTTAFHFLMPCSLPR